MKDISPFNFDNKTPDKPKERHDRIRTRPRDTHQPWCSNRAATSAEKGGRGRPSQEHEQTMPGVNEEELLAGSPHDGGGGYVGAVQRTSLILAART